MYIRLLFPERQQATLKILRIFFKRLGSRVVSYCVHNPLPPFLFLVPQEMNDTHIGISRTRVCLLPIRERRLRGISKTHSFIHHFFVLLEIMQIRQSTRMGNGVVQMDMDM